MSKIRYVELEAAHRVNSIINSDSYVMSKREIDNSVDDIFGGLVSTHEHGSAIYFNSKYVVVAKYDGGTFYLFSSMDKAKVGAPSAKSYEWVLVDGALK